MAWEYEGLFDAIPQDAGLLSEYWRSEATATRIGSMGYRTRTTKAGDRLEAEIYPIFGRMTEQRARAAKKNITPERMKQLNVRNSKRQLVLMLENNFDLYEDETLTLTYAEEPENLKRCRKDVRNFFLRVKRWREKQGLPELRYIYAIGHDKDQRLHVHMAINGGVERKKLIELWGKGIVNSSPMQSYGHGLQGYANYLYKQNEIAKDRGERDGLHMWSGSRNLKKPKVHVSDTKVSNRKVKMLAMDFQAVAREILKKVYPGYQLEVGRVQFSDVVDGVYIRCVMRKTGGGKNGRKGAGAHWTEGQSEGTERQTAGGVREQPGAD